MSRTWDERVRALAKKSGSPEALAVAMGVSFYSIYNWMKGKNRPSPMAQALIAKLEENGQKDSARKEK